jgi:hypothetical protein
MHGSCNAVATLELGEAQDRGRDQRWPAGKVGWQGFGPSAWIAGLQYPSKELDVCERAVAGELARVGNVCSSTRVIGELRRLVGVLFPIVLDTVQWTLVAHPAISARL